MWGGVSAELCLTNPENRNRFNLLPSYKEVDKMFPIKTGIQIESPYSDLLNKVVTEMINRDFTLQAIEKYVSQIEKFLKFMAESDFKDIDVRAYLKSINSDSSLQALHFFFREVLASTRQEISKAPSEALEGLYPQLAV